MMKKEMLLAMLMVGCTANVLGMNHGVNKWGKYHNGLNQTTGEQIFAEPKQKKEPKLLTEGRVAISGNEIFCWLSLDGYQSNPIPNFGQTTVVKLKKNGTYDRRFQLDDLRKERKQRSQGSVESEYNKFQFHMKANNAIECPDLIQLPNRENEVMPVTVVIYGTRNIKHCQLYKEFLEEQKLDKFSKMVENS